MPEKSKATKNKAAAENTAEQSSERAYNNDLWRIPSMRAKDYAEERKKQLHTRGQKKGKKLTDYESGLRSGYLQCQHDHAGQWKYSKALELGYNKSEAGEMSKKPWDKNTPPKKKGA